MATTLATDTPVGRATDVGSALKGCIRTPIGVSEGLGTGMLSETGNGAPDPPSITATAVPTAVGRTTTCPPVEASGVGIVGGRAVGVVTATVGTPVGTTATRGALAGEETFPARSRKRA